MHRRGAPLTQQHHAAEHGAALHTHDDLPARGPAGMGVVLRRIRIVATISLSATGSKNAPNCVLAFHLRAR